jgi:hypothetical protein
MCMFIVRQDLVKFVLGIQLFFFQSISLNSFFWTSKIKSIIVNTKQKVQNTFIASIEALLFLLSAKIV